MSNRADNETEEEHLCAKSSPLQDWEKTEDYYALERDLNIITKAQTGLIPKPEQLRCAMALISGQDFTFVAATGFGKSLVYQMAVMMMKKKFGTVGKFGIVVTPINALGEDQVNACRNLPVPLKAVNLIEEAMVGDPNMVKDVCASKYDIVFLAPEKLLDRKSALHRMLASKIGIKKIGFVLMDECHLVVDWYVNSKSPGCYGLSSLVANRKPDYGLSVRR